jgi:DNA-binding CsgD family transcriptional regulator
MADDSPPFEEVRRLVAGEISWFQTERRFRREDGRVVWGLVSVSLVRSADGAPTLFISQVQDITDRKHAELLDAGRSRATPLSPREAEVLGLLARGLSGTQIGKQLAIGEETVQTHVRRAMKKLDAKTRTQAVASATRLGLLDEGYEPPTSFS